MKRKLMYAAGGLMLLASPIFAQTPAASGGGTAPQTALRLSGDGHRIRPVRPGPRKARSFGLRSLRSQSRRASGHPVRTHFRTGADRIAGVVHAGHNVYRKELVFGVNAGASLEGLPRFPFMKRYL